MQGCSVWTDPLAIHMRYDTNTLNRTVDLAGEAPDAILLKSDLRLLFCVIPSHYVYKTCFDAGLAAYAFFQIDLNAGAHAASKTELIPQSAATRPQTSRSLRIY
jgi:hypothetical protein